MSLPSPVPPTPLPTTIDLTIPVGMTVSIVRRNNDSSRVILITINKNQVIRVNGKITA
jgi:hypothetical protein